MQKSYQYGYLDKVMSVTEGKIRITYGYHVDGQLATVTKGKVTEEFIWDGLALVKRGSTSYMNEPHPGGDAPVVSSNGGVMFNDILGTTLGIIGENGYSPSSMTAFGDAAKHPEEIFFTGKPHVDGLGHVFFLRNYRADLGKWPTADPLGYPDGWNQMAYCRNGVVDCLDFLGGVTKSVTIITRWSNDEWGAIGVPLVDLYKFMKDILNQGVAILDALKINNIADLIDRIDDELSDRVKEKLDDIIGTDKWLEFAMNAAVADGSLPLGFDRVPPTKNQIDAAVGRTDYVIISIDYLGVKSWDVNDAVVGAYFLLTGAIKNGR